VLVRCQPRDKYYKYSPGLNALLDINTAQPLSQSRFTTPVLTQDYYAFLFTTSVLTQDYYFFATLVLNQDDYFIAFSQLFSHCVLDV